MVCQSCVQFMGQYKVIFQMLFLNHREKAFFREFKTIKFNHEVQSQPETE